MSALYIYIYIYIYTEHPQGQVFYIIRINIHNVFARAFGACPDSRDSSPHLGAQVACPPGLLDLPGPQYCLPGPQNCLSWPAGRQLDANWTPVGRQLDANWTPSERQVGLPKRLPVPTYVLRTPKQLPSSTERLASSAYVAVQRQVHASIHIHTHTYTYTYA